MTMIDSIIPVVISALFTILYTSIIDWSKKKKNAKKRLIQRRLIELRDMVSLIKRTILNMQYQMGGSFEDNMTQFFYFAGDLQVYLDENKAAMLEEVGNDDLYLIERINDLNENIHKVGEYMTDNDRLNEFDIAFRAVVKECNELLVDYNKSISKAEFI